MRARARVTRATRKYNKTKYHRKKGGKSTRKKQKRHSRKGGMPPRRRGNATKTKPDLEPEDIPTTPPASPSRPTSPEPTSPEPTPPEPMPRRPTSPAQRPTKTEAIEQLKAQLRAVPPMFRDHYLKSEDQKERELQQYKDTQAAAERRFVDEQQAMGFSVPISLAWKVKTPEEKERIYQQYKKQQEDALARL